MDARRRRSPFTDRSCARQAVSTEITEAHAVDVTPIMNMFVILIPFLISMAVFSQLSILQFTLPPQAGARGGPAPEQLPLTIALTAQEIALTRGAVVLQTLPRSGDPRDFARLANALRDLAGPEDVIIAIDDGLLFGDIVACMDTCRENGFTRISLAEGTGLDREGHGHADD